MSYPVYYVPAGDVLPIFFNTFSGATGASITMTGLAVTDVEIYKDGSTTQRASDAGITLLDTDGIDFDSLTGIHGFSIDTGDNTDASFYTTGSWFHVVVSAVTVDSQTVSFVAAAFRIMAAESSAGVPKADVSHWLGTAAATPTVAGVPEVDITHVLGGGTYGSSGQLSVNVRAVGTSTTAVTNMTAAYDGTGYAGGTTKQEVVLSTAGNAAVADAVWDEAASGHVAAGSFGAVLPVIRSNTAQAGAATTITLDASASAVNDFYNNQRIHIVAGTGVGQGRIISDYDGTTKVATVATWATNPGADSVFVITPFGSIPGATAPTAAEVADAVWDEARADHVSSGSFGQAGQVIRSATAQAGSTSSITLDASASATDDIYNYQVVYIISGTGAGQARQITDYVGSTKVATVGVAFVTAPSSDSVFLIVPLGIDAATVASIADAVWDEARSGHATAGTFGEYVNADTVRLSNSATAADNAQAAFDGTGYGFTGCTIPTVTTVSGNVSGNVVGDVQGNVDGSVASVTGAVGSVTGNVGGNVVGSVASVTATVSADVVSISGDGPAADTLESYLDGTDVIPANIIEVNSQTIGASKPYDVAT